MEDERGRDRDEGGRDEGERDAAVRVATAAEVAWLLELAADEGWNPGIDDGEAFRAADPEGFLVATDGGRPVAGLSVVRQDARFGFLGLYLCAPASRGQGYGWRAWQAGLDHLGARTVGLDGVPAQQANYRASGFTGAWRNVRFAGAAPVPSANGDGSEGRTGSEGEGEGGGEGEGDVDGRWPRPRAVRDADPKALRAYDRAIGGVDRAAFLSSWLADTGTRRSLWCEAEGRVCALGTIRRCREGAKIGPLLADSPFLARRLLLALVEAVGARSIVLDVPEENAPAMAMAASLGLSPVFETMRMYRGDAPRVDLERLHGVATLELG